MKFHLFLACACLLLVPLTTAQAHQSTDSFEMAGTWICSDPGWVDLVIFNKDGTFRRAQGDAGRWTLHEGVLTLHWKGWPEETLRLYSNDEFRGKPRDENSQAEIVMHRCN